MHTGPKNGSSVFLCNSYCCDLLMTDIFCQMLPPSVMSLNHLTSNNTKNEIFSRYNQIWPMFLYQHLHSIWSIHF